MIDDTKDTPPEDTAAADEIARKMAAEMAKEMEDVPEKFRDDSAEASEEQGDDALASLRADLDAAKQDVLYARAETQNVRRRLEKDIQDARNYAATGFARDMLSVSDNLARALDSMPAELREDDRLKSFVAGIEATRREVEKVFSQHGIKRIAAVGLPLDPHLHQAMMEVEAGEGQEAGTIVQELQPGYTINDRLLRPAMVSVARK